MVNILNGQYVEYIRKMKQKKIPFLPILVLKLKVRATGFTAV